MEKPKSTNGEIYFTIFLMFISVCGFITTFTWKVLESDTSGGPSMFPRIVLGGLFFASFIRLVQILRTEKDAREAFVFLNLFQSHRGFFLLMLVLYAASIPFLGFILSTTIYLNVTANTMIYFTKGSVGPKKNIFIRFVALTATAIAIFIFFERALRVMVPTGIFGI